MISRTPVCVLGWLLMVLASSATASETVTVGVNVVNPQRLSAADREALLDQLQTAGVHVIRVPLAPAWGSDDYGPAIDLVRRASERGIKADLIVGLQYRDGAQRRPAVKELPAMWPSFPLSAADPERFRAVFEPLFDQLETMGITFAALELGNEINWTAFNGNFPIPGEGRVFAEADLTRDPEAIRIAEGYRAYLQALSVLKEIRDHRASTEVRRSSPPAFPIPVPPALGPARRPMRSRSVRPSNTSAPMDWTRWWTLTACTPTLGQEPVPSVSNS